MVIAKQLATCASTSTLASVILTYWVSVSSSSVFLSFKPANPISASTESGRSISEDRADFDVCRATATASHHSSISLLSLPGQRRISPYNTARLVCFRLHLSYIEVRLWSVVITRLSAYSKLLHTPLQHHQKTHRLHGSGDTHHHHHHCCFLQSRLFYLFVK